MELYIYAYIGMLLYILLDLYGLQESTPNLTFSETIKEYFTKNVIPLIAGAILLFVVISLSVTGDLGFLQPIINLQSGGPGALLLGLTSQTILTALRRIIRPMQVVTSGNKVVETPPKV